MLRAIRWINFTCLTVDLSALAAHLLELPNKLRLDGPLWLAVQQHLYRGWGPFLAPFEVGAVASAWVLVVLVRGRPAFAPTLGAAVCLTVVLVAFFVVVQPMNVAFEAWTPLALPPVWSGYRLQWELGHAGRALLAVVALGSLVRAAQRP